MIDVTFLDGIYNVFSWKSKRFYCFNSFLVNFFCRIVLSNATIVGIVELYLVIIIVKQVIDVNIVNVT